jgi:DNA-binding FadR family transcriptional regulator
MVETHRRLATAIVEGDPKAARQFMVKHFDEARRAILGLV